MARWFYTYITESETEEDSAADSCPRSTHALCLPPCDKTSCGFQRPLYRSEMIYRKQYQFSAAGRCTTSNCDLPALREFSLLGSRRSKTPSRYPNELSAPASRQHKIRGRVEVRARYPCAAKLLNFTCTSRSNKS
nr:hypothetical protein CFP56_02944 [Quercus suber]